MIVTEDIKEKLGKVFPKKQAVVLTEVFVKFQDGLVQAGDFNELKDIVKELGIKVGELAEAQTRTEERIEELAEAQKGSEKRLARVEDELTLFRRTFTSMTGGLGARWGIMAESSFRNAIEGILSEVGFKTEQFIARDEEGIVFGYPEIVELDIVVQNGRLFVIEIKSSISKADIILFDKKVSFYKKQTQKVVHRKIAISPYIEPAASNIAKRLGIEVFTDINEVR